jgi:hypothetical protein
LTAGGLNEQLLARIKVGDIMGDNIYDLSTKSTN